MTSDYEFTPAEIPTTDGLATENATEVVTADDVTPRVDELGHVNTEVPATVGQGDIIYVERTLVDGVMTDKTHGPMPVSEWADYARANGF